MVAAISETTNQTRRPRPPLLSSEIDHGIIPSNKSIKPKSKQVSSRYSSPSPSHSHLHSPSISILNSSSVRTSTPSRRHPSPLLSRNSTTPAAKRSVSADRRRPTKPDLHLKPNNSGEVSEATKLLLTSTRSLSVSFQGKSFSLPINKTKVPPPAANSSSMRKGAPLRIKVENGGGDHVENTKPIDQHRWPRRTHEDNNIKLAKSLNLDCGFEKSKFLESEIAIRALNQSMNDDAVELLKPIRQNPIGNLVKDSSGPNLSYTDSVSSGSTSSIQENGGLARLRNRSRGITVSTKIWQETNKKMKLLASPRFGLSKKFLSESSLSSPSRMRPVSPSKFMTSSPLRGMVSTDFSESPSVLSFGVVVRRRKVGENRIVDAHILRLMHNRQLQWRFVNARTEDTLLKRKRSAEKYLWNAWITTLDLHDSVTKKRHGLQLLRQKLKLASILKQQIAFLENWASLDKDHSRSLLGAIEALEGSTLRLPVGVGAIADLQSMKDAMSSAIVMMQTMGSSIRSLCLKVEEVSSMVTELANICAKERALIRICKDFLSVLTVLKAKDCSLRTHMLQTIHV